MNLTTEVENTNDENDTVDYSSLTGVTDKIIVDLSNTSSANVSVIVSNVVQGADTLVNIENIIGTSGNDTITGNSDSNNLNGGAGDDYFYVKDAAISGENDVIIGGNNTSIGDSVDFSQIINSNYFVDVNLSSQKLLLKDLSNSNATVRDDSVSGIENITGTNNKDLITGDDSNNSINGASGTDTIYGGKGEDIIQGGANSAGDASNVYEILDGGEGIDTIYGGTGNDSIDGVS